MIATCPERETLRGYANGTVPEEQADELTSHLRDCSSCQQWLADTDDLDDTLVGELRNSTVDASFDLEPDCQSAMARALGALALDADEMEAGDFSLPSSIGDYEIVRRIGRGGMGNVYLAQHTRLDRTVAVKVLASHRLADPRMHERFEKEMKAVGSLSHPNVVTAHDARDVDGLALLVTEWIDGLNLKDVVDRIGPLDVADACEIGVRIAAALEYISAENLIHRDLKPSNVMISRDGEVKLLDLGLARLRDESEGGRDATATGQAMGTADYVAPEQINDARAVDIRADIYSLGCTLYKLFSGRAPFENERYTTVFSKLTAHVSDSPTPLRSVAPHVPQALSDLVGQMLAKSPDDRPSSPELIKAKLQVHVAAADLQALLERALVAERKSPTSSDIPPAQPTTQGFWDRRVPITVAIAGALGGLFAGWLLGVLITITHPDGSKTQVEVPENSRAVIDPSGNVDVTLGTADSPPAIPSDALVPPDDSASLDGIWKFKNAMYRGRGAPMQSIENGAMIFHDDGFVFMQRSKPIMTGTWHLDSDRNRISLDGKAPQAGESVNLKGLYRLKGDNVLQIFVRDSADGDFPAVFDSPREFNTSTITLLKVEEPTNNSAMKDFMQVPANRDLLHAMALYRTLREGADPNRFAQAYNAMNQSAEKTETLNKLKQLGLAFHYFHDAHRVFPASSSGRFGKSPEEGEYPVSWRVAILPFIEQQELFEQYHFDEPWDSDHNLTLLAKMPDAYRRPGSTGNPTATAFVGIAGEKTALGENEARRIRDIIDGTSNTVLLLEAETEIPWTKPEDIRLEDLSKSKILDQDVLRVVMADGSVRELKKPTEESIRQAVIINNGR